MIIFIIISILLFPHHALAINNAGCAKIGASMYIGLTDAIVEDLSISRDQIIQKNVSVEVISVSPITKVYAEQLAKEDYKKWILISSALVIISTVTLQTIPK
ncbi:hypothetical protein [Rosenbergiella epipactidis]|uniref:hypothetical protein n=1 Tax=Rosenbergiella epipactidis TaxID=1544694 RepID=UPI001F503AD9|nr:hypothetical protein [Rosenbergiella epipactidis]